MKDLNAPPVQSPALAFNDAFQEAQATGDFSFVLKTARDSERMLRDFRQAVLTASFAGRDSFAIGTGLNFLESLIVQSAAQVKNIGRTEKETREAIKAARRNQKMSVVGPEEESSPAPEVPGEVSPPGSPEAPSEPSAPADVNPVVPPEPIVQEVLNDQNAGWEKEPVRG